VPPGNFTTKTVDDEYERAITRAQRDPRTTNKHIRSPQRTLTIDQSERARDQTLFGLHSRDVANRAVDASTPAADQALSVKKQRQSQNLVAAKNVIVNLRFGGAAPGILNARSKSVSNLDQCLFRCHVCVESKKARKTQKKVLGCLGFAARGGVKDSQTLTHPFS
jgi:hypothetical protein